MQGEDIQVGRNLVPLADQAHLRDEAGGQPLEARDSSNPGVGAGDVGPGGDIGRLEALVDLPAGPVVKNTEGQPGKVFHLRPTDCLLLQNLSLHSVVALQQGVGYTEIDLVIHQLVADQPGVILPVEGDGKIQGIVQHQRLQLLGNGIGDPDIYMGIAGGKLRQNGGQTHVQPEIAGAEAEHPPLLVGDVRQNVLR